MLGAHVRCIPPEKFFLITCCKNSLPVAIVIGIPALSVYLSAYEGTPIHPTFLIGRIIYVLYRRKGGTVKIDTD
jgi:hypothetical protein